MSAPKGNNFSTLHGCNRGGKRTKSYRTWSHILGRCNNPRDADYHNYGGRGIKVCERWEIFSNFLADMGEPQDGLTLERIDNDGNYEPGNCRWALRSDQNKNTRRTIIIDGVCLKDYCEKHNLPYEAVQMRIRRGMDKHQAVGAKAHDD